MKAVFGLLFESNWFKSIITSWTFEKKLLWVVLNIFDVVLCSNFIQMKKQIWWTGLCGWLWLNAVSATFLFFLSRPLYWALHYCFPPHCYTLCKYSDTGMFNSPGMQSMMQQLVSNPQMMQSAMQAPVFQAMAANPELARQASNWIPL